MSIPATCLACLSVLKDATIWYGFSFRLLLYKPLTMKVMEACGALKRMTIVIKFRVAMPARSVEDVDEFPHRLAQLKAQNFLSAGVICCVRFVVDGPI